MKVAVGIVAISAASIFIFPFLAAGGSDLYPAHSASSSSTRRQIQWHWRVPNKDLHDYDHHHRSLTFGDYVDPSFSCPATVTCNIVCVTNITECPADALCPGTRNSNYDQNVNSANHTYEVRERESSMQEIFCADKKSSNKDLMQSVLYIYIYYHNEAMYRRNLCGYYRRTSM